MSEQESEYTSACPWWCRNVADDGGLHAHVSEDVVAGEGGGEGEGTLARMIQLAGSDMVRVVIGQSVVSVEEARGFAHALLRLASGAQLAEPGMGFVETLASAGGLSTGEMALASGIDSARLRQQRSGAQVLSVREFDRLALAVAQVMAMDRPADLDEALAEQDTDELDTDEPAWD